MDVDVVISVYNGARYLGSTIESVLAQTTPPRAIVVVDDGSSDDSASVARRYPSVTLIQKPNGGVGSARNEGLRACGSELVAFLDGDDLWLPQKLSLQCARFRDSELPDLGVVYCDYDDIDAAGNTLHDFPSRRLTRGLRGRIKRRLYRGNLVAGSASAVLVRRACLEEVGGFDESLRCAEDWDMWLRLAQRYAFDYVDQVLVRLRRHGGSMQATRAREMLHSALDVLARQHGGVLDRVLVLEGSLRWLASTREELVDELLTSELPEDTRLLERLSCGVPLPLVRTLVRGARTVRQLRAGGKAHFA